MISLKKTFIKTVLRDLKRNLSRFVAIIAIVALGVGFLIGLLSATPDLQHSANVFYDEQNTYDINIKSSIGFSKDEIQKLPEEVDGISQIEGFYQMDVILSHENTEISARIIEHSKEDQINQLDLVEGRYPQNESECLVLNKGIYFENYQIGSSVSLEGKNYQIVGACTSAVYYYKLLEPTQIGTGNLDAIYYIPKREDSIITDIVITVEDVLDLDCFKNPYFEKVDVVCQKLENVSASHLEDRIDKLKKDAFEEGYLQAKNQYKEILIHQGLSENQIEMLLQKEDEQIRNRVQDLIDTEFESKTLEWYILNRKSNTTYVSFKDNSNKVNDVAVVFPFFFFFIAGLIALTSITRMVSEDRGSIGTLKSLGYSNPRILSKYLFYAGFACTLGSVIGILTGVYILPVVIYSCYNSLFVMPAAHYLWSAPIILLSAISMSLTILLVMLLLCIKTLKEKPNSLMVPKAPKAGKRILLERVGFLWKLLKFRYKSAIRNIFRFKRNLIMMMVGIGGCTGLMLVAFGLRDSMNSFSKKQYDEIFKYDFIIEAEKPEWTMLSDSHVLPMKREAGRMKKDDAYEVTILYATDEITDYMDVGTKELPREGVLISKQLSTKLGLRQGKQFEIETDKDVCEYTVSNVFDNFIGNYIIVYQQIENPSTYLVQLGKEDLQNYDQIVKEMYRQDQITKVEDLHQIRKNYDSMSENIEIIIYVIILCSGALAVIVIYNLTNINIEERIREIATLKVIGYQKKEVLGYIYREITMMSIAGILVGFILGPILNYFVMDRISSPGQYFSAMLSWQHFIYAFLITILFVFIVFLLFIPKVKKIKMVESLKCVE